MHVKQIDHINTITHIPAPTSETININYQILNRRERL